MWDTILTLWKFGGASAVKRALTPPASFVRRVCERTGADPEQALEERGEMTQQMIEFLESLTDKDFEDPD